MFEILYRTMFGALNQSRWSDAYRSVGTLEKRWVAKLAYSQLRIGDYKKRIGSTSPEFFIPDPIPQKATSKRTQDAQNIPSSPRDEERTGSKGSGAIPTARNTGQATLPAVPASCTDVALDAPGKSSKVHEYYFDDAEGIDRWEEEEINFDWYKDFERNEATLDLKMFPENDDSEEVTRLIGFDLFIPEDPISPILVPFGSGRKGKGKSKEEYSADAAELGYKGGYSQYPTHANLNNSNGRPNGDDPSDRDNSSGNGNGGGGRDRGDHDGDGDGDDQEMNGEQVTTTSQTAFDSAPVKEVIQQPLALRYGDSRRSLPNSVKFGWACVCFL